MNFVCTVYDVRTRDFSTLTKMMIKDLSFNKKYKGCYIEGKLVQKPTLFRGLYTLIEDDNGDKLRLALYNIISGPLGPKKCELAKIMYPKDLRLKIANPYLKMFLDGSVGIRVDDPEDVQRIDIEEIRMKGKKLMQKREYLQALELYLNVANDISHSVTSLLNNRAQAEIKLEQYEEALLDSASVLFFSSNEKALQRYQISFEHLKSHGGGSCDEQECIKNVWMKTLKKMMLKVDFVGAKGCKRDGKEAYAAGNYEEAKQQYTSALLNPNLCIILTNIGIVCLELNILQTAISALSVCLRISRDNARRQKTMYCMAKALLMLGEPEMYRVASKHLRSSKTLNTFRDDCNNCEKDFEVTIKNFYHTHSRINSRFKEILCDFVKHDSIEYIKGERCVKAKKNIRSGQLLLIEHSVTINGQDGLLTNLATLLKYDGLLSQKLSYLQINDDGIDDGDYHPLLDFKHFGYRILSYDVPPFLPQRQEFISGSTVEINESFIVKMEEICKVKRADKIKAFGLRISLFNQAKVSNCENIKVKDALIVYAKHDIQGGCELRM